MGALFLAMPFVLAARPDAQWALAANALSMALAGLVAFAALWPLLPHRPAVPGDICAFCQTSRMPATAAMTPAKV